MNELIRGHAMSRAGLTVHRATLPSTYVDAKTALAKCDQVDECKKWADKAAALASYAKQAKDEQLLDFARRIRLRAIERGGELLQAIKPDKGGRPAETRGRASPSLTRKAAANGAGLSPDQAKTMLRVANVPKEERESLIESACPPTVGELAKRGTEKKPRLKPPPHRDEWCDWIIAIQDLAEIPQCGLEPLLVHCPDMVEQHINEATKARQNLKLWLAALKGE